MATRKIIYLFWFILSMCLMHPLVSYCKEKEIKELGFAVDEGIMNRTLTRGEIKLILDQFDTYDYVRLKNQKENLVKHLLDQSEKNSYSEAVGRCQNILGVIHRDKAEYAKAIEMHESAYFLSGEADTALAIYSLNNLGVVYRRLDKPRLALDYHIKALDLAEKFKGNKTISKQSVCVALNSIGNINIALNQPEEALEVFNKSLLLEQELKNDLGIAINYQNIGFAYEAMGKIDIALDFYKKSLERNEAVNSLVGRAICYNSIGEVQLKRKEYLEAINNFRLALVYAEQSNDNYYISQTHANIGKTYLSLAKYEKAYPELIEYKKNAEAIGSGLLIADAYSLLSQYYEETNDAKKALSYYKIAMLHNDSIINEKNSRYLNEIQTLYDAKKKEQQIDLLTSENKMKTQKNYLYLTLTIAMLLTVMVIYIYTKRDTDRQKAELESRLFRSLMNPHFIFNALASIQSFLYKNEPEKAATYLGHFSKLTRSVLTNSNKELITLEEELKSLKNYIEIEQMRQRDCFTYSIEMEDELELDFIYVLPTMIQPFVENAIIHGLCGKKDHDGMLKVEIKMLDEHVRIQISDNGKGYKTSIKEPNDTDHDSMGLSIFKERIRLIERKYKKSVNFTIDDLSDLNKELTGTVVTIDFPIIEPYD